MAVPIPDDIRKEMAQEGVFTLINANPELPTMGKKEISKIISDLKTTGANQFLNNLDPSTVLQLPYIFKVSPENMIEMDGKPYYAITVKESEPVLKKRTINGKEYNKGDIYPGEVILMDVENGNPVSFTFDEAKDKIRTPSRMREETLQKFNEEVNAYNKKLDVIGMAAGPTRLNLQIASAEDKIKNRINNLISMEQWYISAIDDPVHVSPAYGKWIEYLKNNYMTFGIRDIFDTLLFLYQSNPQDLINKIQNNQVAVPEEIKPALLGLAAQEINLKEEKINKEKAKEEAREQAKEEMLPEFKEPKEEPLTPYTIQDIPEKKYKTPSKFKTLHTWAASLKYALKGIQKDKKELEDIVSTFSGLRKYIAGISKSMEYLKSPEGKDNVNDLKRFMDAAQVFLKRYQGNIIENRKIDENLLGREGTPGNALIAVRLINIYNVIRRAIDQIESQEITPPEKTKPIPEVAPIPVEASYKNKIKRMSELLWMAFENRGKIR